MAVEDRENVYGDREIDRDGVVVVLTSTCWSILTLSGQSTGAGQYCDKRCLCRNENFLALSFISLSLTVNPTLSPSISNPPAILSLLVCEV